MRDGTYVRRGFRGSIVIVSCPSCGVRYRVDSTPGDDRGRCAGCGGIVPFVSAPRSYVLVQATAGGAPWSAAQDGAPVAVPTRSPSAGPAFAQGRPAAQADRRSAARDPGIAQPAPYDPWTQPDPSEEASFEPIRSVQAPAGRAGSPLLPALLAGVGALCGYWAGMQGFLSGLPLVSAAGPAGLAVLGASLGLLVGWAGDRWTASQ